jgi:hypothetical protein
MRALGHFYNIKAPKKLIKKWILNNKVVMFTKDMKVSCFSTVWSAHKEEIFNVHGCDLDLSFYVFIIEY